MDNADRKSTYPCYAIVSGIADGRAGKFKKYRNNWWNLQKNTIFA